MKSLTLSSLDELPDVASEILQFAGDMKVFAFSGEMGAGKTTLIKELCRQLGSSDNFSSPTFSIVNEYKIDNAHAVNGSRASGSIYHLDLFRLKDIEEARSAGIEEYMSGDDYCFIEWYQLAETLLPSNALKIDIKASGPQREIVIFNS